jgi:N-acetylmuramoyl-L-alanine amidase
MKVDRQQHRLEGGTEVTHLESANRSGKFAPGMPDTIIIHFTAGASAASAIQTLCDPAREVSAHLVVGRDGTVSQLLPFDTVGWHAGRSRWQNRTSLNQYSIGIEVDNAGRLAQTEGARYLSWFGREFEEAQVVRAVHRNESALSCWHRFPPAQIAVVESLCRLLIDAYGISSILGHEEIAPDRKEDPGPAFPLDEMRHRLLAPQVDATTGVVTAARLNIRQQPAASEPTVAGHLKRGTPVRIVGRKRGWLNVKVELEGWVSERYIDAET